MGQEESDIADLNPHVVRKSADETGGEFVRFESTMYPASVATPAARRLSHEPWGLDNDFEHVHPDQTERWEVLAGTLRVEHRGETHVLTDGESITLPADVPHRHYNPTDRPVRVRWDRRPAFDSAAWAESVYALAQAGKTDAEGLPNPLQIPVWIDAFPEETAYPAAVPVRVQRALASVLAPVGRAAGFEARYTREAVATEQ